MLCARCSPNGGTELKLSIKHEGSGFPVVFLHAFPLDGSMWAQNASALRNAGFRTILVDLPGFGASHGKISSIPETAANVSQALTRAGIEKAVIVGLSMGGYVAFEILKCAPELFAAAILCDTTSEADTTQKRESRNAAIAEIRTDGPGEFMDGLAEAMISRHTLDFHPAVARNIRSRFDEADPESVCAALQAMSERNSSTRDLKSIKFSTLLLFGADDPMLEDGRMMDLLIPSSRLCVLENAGHFSNLEAPEAFSSEAVRFLETLILE